MISASRWACVRLSVGCHNTSQSQTFALHLLGLGLAIGGGWRFELKPLSACAFAHRAQEKLSEFADFRRFLAIAGADCRNYSKFAQALAKIRNIDWDPPDCYKF